MVKMTLESQLFTWDGWDDFGIMSPAFYKVQLTVPIGPFPVGHKFEAAMIDGDKSTISFVEEDETTHVFELKMSVGRQIA